MSELYAYLLKLIFYLLLIIVSFMALCYFWNHYKYKKSAYFKESGNTFLKTFHSKGNWGEYELFTMLEKLKGNRKIMSNLYIPLKDDSCTEVDLLMIHETGIYVFEVKNYSGWIFGNEKNKMWTQTLPNGDKHQFYNPIWQNKGHISAINCFLNKQYTNQLYSYIMFGERCELKKITVVSNDVVVTQKNNLIKALKKKMKYAPQCFTQKEIQEIYQTLKPKTRVDNATKQKHIQKIKRKHG